MHQQLAFPVEIVEEGVPRAGLDEIRLLIAAAPPKQVCRLAVRCRGGRSPAYRRVVAELLVQRARKMRNNRVRRRLYWALGELHAGLGELCEASSFYAKAAAGLDDEYDPLVVACTRERALCLSRLGFQTEAQTEYERFRAARRFYPPLMWAALEERLGDRQRALGLVRDSLLSYGRAQGLYQVSGRSRAAASCLMECARARVHLLQLRHAVETLRAARDLYDSIDDQWGVARAYQALSDTFRLIGDAEQQFDAARRAFTGYQRVHEPYLAAVATAACADSPPSKGIQLVPFDSPVLLIHLGVCMDPN